MHRLYRELCCVLTQSTAIVDNWPSGLWITGGSGGLVWRRKRKKGEGSGGAFRLYLFVKKDQDQIVCTYASYSA